MHSDAQKCSASCINKSVDGMTSFTAYARLHLFLNDRGKQFYLKFYIVKKMILLSAVSVGDDELTVKFQGSEIFCRPRR